MADGDRGDPEVVDLTDDLDRYPKVVVVRLPKNLLPYVLGEQEAGGPFDGPGRPLLLDPDYHLVRVNFVAGTLASLDAIRGPSETIEALIVTSVLWKVAERRARSRCTEALLLS